MISLFSGGGSGPLTQTVNADGFSIAGGTVSRTLTITGANVTINQTLQTTDSPTFSALTLTAPLTIANGGTGLATTPTDGQLLIGKTSTNAYAKAALTGTANQVVVTNGSGSITLSTPQNIDTGATPQFARLGLGAAADAATLLTLTGGTVTVSTPLINATQTWNAGAVTFTALKLNVTDTASAAASLLMDLQVGSTSQWNVSKAGKTTQAGVLLASSGTAGAPTYSFSADATTGMYRDTGGGAIRFSVFGTLSVEIGGGTLKISSDSALFRMGVSSDVVLARDAANVLAQRNGATAQVKRLYNTFTDASNYERLGINWVSNLCTIKTEAAGTGTLRGLNIGGAITDLVGFYGVTPIAQRATAAQAAVVTTAATNVTPFGYATQAQADAIVTLVNELRAALVVWGAIKGAA